MATRTAFDATAGSVLTATNLDKHAGGWIGYVQVTANQTSITSLVDITSLTLTVTALASRYHKTTMFLGSLASTVSADSVNAHITDGSNVDKQIAGVTLGAAGAGATMIVQVVETGWSGSTTRKGRIERAAGTGTITLGAAATQPAFLLIEDMGSA